MRWKFWSICLDPSAINTLMRNYVPNEKAVLQLELIYIANLSSLAEFGRWILSSVNDFYLSIVGYPVNISYYLSHLNVPF